MKTDVKWLLGVAILVLLSPTFVWLFISGSESNPDLLREKPLTVPWRAGASQQYQLQFNSKMKMNTGGNGTNQSMDMSLRAGLDTYTLKASAGVSATVGMKLSDVNLNISGQVDSETNIQLQTPFRVQFEFGAIPVLFEFPESVSLEHRGILENIVRNFQVSVRAGDSWSVQEANMSGQYDASYTRVTGTQIEKTKLNFSGSIDNPLLMGAEVSSEESFELREKIDWIQRMDVHEILRTGNAAAGPAFETTNEASIELLSVGQSRVTDQSWNFIAGEASNPVTLNSNNESGLTIIEAREKITASLRKLDTTRVGRTNWIHELRDLLLIDDALPAFLLDQLKAQEFSDRTQADLYLALELAGSPAAQQALASVINDRTWTTKDNLRAIVALSGLQDPTPETLEVLWNTAEVDDRSRLNGTATYALGTLAKTMKRIGNENHQEVSQRLLTGAQSGLIVDRRANYVHALGNTGNAEHAYDVSVMMDDLAPEIRRAAAQSLALLDVDGYGEQLVSYLGKENNSQVRAAIAETLVNWQKPTSSAARKIKTAIASETDESARLQMARFLGESLEQFPDNTEVLEDLLKIEQSKRIRQTISDSLAKSRGVTGKAQSLQ